MIVQAKELKEELIRELFEIMKALDEYSTPENDSNISDCREKAKLQGRFEGTWNAIQKISPGSYSFLNPINLFILTLFIIQEVIGIVSM